MAVWRAVRIPLVHSSVPVLTMDSEQMEQYVLVCAIGHLLRVVDESLS